MMLPQAQRVFAEFLAPLGLDEFLDQGLAGGFRSVPHGGNAARLELLGPEPEALLAGAVHLAPKLTYHSANALGPAPSLAGVTDAADFRSRIAAFHALNYSVRFPELRALAPAADRVARALEILLHQPVTVAAFWSKSGMRAPVHYDDHDLIVVQLKGAKRWFVTKTPSVLPNAWKGVSGDAPELGDHHVVDVRPGDLMYLPRGTFHTVDSETESLHVAIGFTPLTVREALIAALDHLSDLDPGLRATLGARLGYQMRGAGLERLTPPVADAAARLAEAVRAPGFVGAAMHRRSSRVVSGFEAGPRPPAGSAPKIGLDTLLRQRPGAFSHLTGSAETIDFAYPGGHLYIHRGAQAAVVFVADTAEFRVRHIPGDLDEAVRIALATRFVEVGFLEVADG
jgi:hypothetical protein